MTQLQMHIDRLRVRVQLPSPHRVKLLQRLTSRHICLQTVVIPKSIHRCMLISRSIHTCMLIPRRCMLITQKQLGVSPFFCFSQLCNLLLLCLLPWNLKGLQKSCHISVKNLFLISTELYCHFVQTPGAVTTYSRASQKVHAQSEYGLLGLLNMQQFAFESKCGTPPDLTLKACTEYNRSETQVTAMHHVRLTD